MGGVREIPARLLAKRRGGRRQIAVLLRLASGGAIFEHGVSGE